LGFLTSTTWDPVKEEFGGLVMIYGTLMTSLIALLIAVPVSFGIALFLTDLSPAWLKRPLGTAIELLAACLPLCMACGVCWCLVRCWPPMCSSLCRPFSRACRIGAFVSGPPVGIGILSAGIILAIMIIPFIAR
jgi:phosphate transport system permease protein